MTGLIESLAGETGLRVVDILRIMNRAPLMYKVYEIDKRSRGKRVIAQPAREVKFVQIALVDILLDKLPIHDSATAYPKGLSIRDNALPHARNGPILKLDLREFFPSIRSMDWVSYCETNDLGLSRDEIMLTSRLLFYKRADARNLSLAIGAPSSPIVSNILMYSFDCKIIENLENDLVVYTRYADDMTFSAPRTGYLNGVMKTVAQTIREVKFPKLDINSKKTTYITMKYGRSVTGLTLSNDGRVTIGRDNKRKLSAVVHHASNGGLDVQQLQVAAGMLAYVHAVEPEFLDKLRHKYGDDLITAIQKTVLVGSRPSPHPAPLAQVPAVSRPATND